MGTPHKHAEVIKAWANGEDVQYHENGIWKDAVTPFWEKDDDTEWRIKPEPEYPETRMTDGEIRKIYFEHVGDANASYRAVANAVIRRAIQDGDVAIVQK